MGKNFWKIINDLISESDLIIEVLDARLEEATRNKEIEDKIQRAGKKLLYVITKCDLVKKETLEQEKKRLKPCVFVSAKEHYGTMILLQKIMELAKGKQVIVAVVGYPNVGKSSVINALKGKKSAGVSSKAGFTKAKQKVSINEVITLMDTPGVFSYQEDDEQGLALIGSKDAHQLKDPEGAAYAILDLFIKNERKQALEEYYTLSLEHDSPEDILEELALKKKKLRKGNTPDTETMARIVISDWQRGYLQ